MAAEKFEIPGAEKRCYLVGQSDVEVVIANADEARAFFIDLTTWPPKVEEVRESYVQRVTWARDGRRLVLDSLELEDAAYDIRIHTGDERLDCPRIADERRYGFLWGGIIGDRIVGWPGARAPYPKDLPSLETCAVVFTDDAWTEAEGLDMVEFAGGVDPLLGTVSLADGGELLIWMGDAYELRDGRFEKLLSLAAKSSRVDWTWHPAGEDGFFYIDDRKLREVHRGGEPVTHLEKEELVNVIRMAPGPAGSLLLRLGTNPLKALGVIYDPAAGSVKPLSAELLGLKRVEGLHWSEASGRLIAVGKAELTSLSADEIAGLPTL